MALPGRLYVQFADDHRRLSGGTIDSKPFDQAARRYRVTSIEKAFPSLDVIASHRPLAPSTEALRRVYILRYDAPNLPRHVADDFSKVPGVRYAEPIYKSELYGPVPVPDQTRRATPDDAYYSDQTHLPFMRLEEAWDVVKGQDSTALIAIVDGGTQWQHEDLAGNVWTNPGETDGDGIDNDGNGYVDDIHGWNFTNSIPDPNGPAGSITNEHGTAVAGAAAAITNNSTGIAGASWNARFMALNTSCDDQSGLCYVIDAVLYAAMNGADAVSASYGNTIYSATNEMVYRSATDEGALIVAAAGNTGTDNDLTPHYPSSFPMVLSVGATQKSSDVSFLNYGHTVNVFAPGENIEVPIPGNGYSQFSGTSFSAPLTAGVAALVKTAFPHFDAHQVREQIRLTAVSIDHANTPTGKFGNGKVDAYAAVTEAPKPGIRVTNWSYQNQDGLENSRAGDAVEVTVTFTNYHGAGTDVSAELTSDGSHLQWTTQNVLLGNMNTGDTKDVVFRFSVGAQAPRDTWMSFSPKITAQGFEDSPDVFSFIVNQASVHHITQALEASVTEEGNIGHRSYKYASGGATKGFTLTTRDGTRRDVLWEGGLLIGVSPTQISDCIRQQESDPTGQQADWAPVSGSRLEFTSPGPRTSQETRVVLSDEAADNPIGVEVLQETFVANGSVNEDFIIYRYTVTNKSVARIEDMYVGLFMDWDVSEPPYDDDDAMFDATRGVGYIADWPSGATAVAGTLLLTSQTLNYSAIDNQRIYRGNAGDGFTPAEKWYYLTGGIRNNGVTGPNQDVSQMTSAGPLTLEVGAEVEVAFALIAGQDEDDFLINVDHARALWNAVFVSTAVDNPPTDTWDMHSPYPHPADFPVVLRFETGASSVVQLEIFDLLGRRVRQLLDAPRSGGIHEVVWDGHSSSGIRVAPGMYMARMTATQDRQVFTRSRAITVLR